MPRAKREPGLRLSSSSSPGLGQEHPKHAKFAVARYGIPVAHLTAAAVDDKRLFSDGIPYPCVVSERLSRPPRAVAARGAEVRRVPMLPPSCPWALLGQSGACDRRGRAGAALSSSLGCRCRRAGDGKCVSGYTQMNGVGELCHRNRTKRCGSTVNLHVLRSPFKNIERLLRTIMIFFPYKSKLHAGLLCLGFFSSGLKL